MAVLAPSRPGSSALSETALNLDAYLRRVDYFVRGRLLEAGKRWKRRVITERMSEPPAQDLTRQARILRRLAKGPLGKKTGRAQRSCRFWTKKEGDVWKLHTSIGAGAYYVDDYQDRIHSEKIFAEVEAQALEEIRIGMQIISRDIRHGAGTSIPDEAPTLLSGDASELRGHFEALRLNQRLNSAAYRARKRDSETASSAFNRLSRGVGRILGGLR